MLKGFSTIKQDKESNMVYKHWFEMSIKGTGSRVYDCIEMRNSSRSEAEKVLKGKWPSLNFVGHWACSDTPPSWYK